MPGLVKISILESKNSKISPQSMVGVISINTSRQAAGVERSNGGECWQTMSINESTNSSVPSIFITEQLASSARRASSIIAACRAWVMSSTSLESRSSAPALPRALHRHTTSCSPSIELLGSETSERRASRSETTVRSYEAEARLGIGARDSKCNSDESQAAWLVPFVFVIRCTQVSNNLKSRI